jgi:hypothetical protein
MEEPAELNSNFPGFEGEKGIQAATISMLQAVYVKRRCAIIIVAAVPVAIQYRASVKLSLRRGRNGTIGQSRLALRGPCLE